MHGSSTKKSKIQRRPDVSLEVRLIGTILDNNAQQDCVPLDEKFVYYEEICDKHGSNEDLEKCYMLVNTPVGCQLAFNFDLQEATHRGRYKASYSIDRLL